MAAKAHHHHSIQARSVPWLAKARERFDASIKTLAHPTETLQAAVWIVFQAYVMADMSEMWVFLGKACRLANLLGYDRVDSTRVGTSPLAPAPRDEVEQEERRKTMWELFYLDRAMSCLCGWAVAIDDKQFMVNFPIDDEVFQASTAEMSLAVLLLATARYSRSTDSRTSSIRTLYDTSTNTRSSLINT